MPPTRKKTRRNKAKAAYGSADYREPQHASQQSTTSKPPRSSASRKAASKAEKSRKAKVLFHDEANEVDGIDGPGSGSAAVKDLRNVHMTFTATNDPCWISLALEMLGDALHGLREIGGETDWPQTWDNDFGLGEAETASAWLESNDVIVEHPLVAEALLRLVTLWKGIETIPSVSDVDLQCRDLEVKEKDINQVVTGANELIVRICLLLQEHAENTQGLQSQDISHQVRKGLKPDATMLKQVKQGRADVEEVLHRLIPVLSLTVKAAMLLGSPEAAGTGVPESGHFTSLTLQLLYRTCFWTKQLAQQTKRVLSFSPQLMSYKAGVFSKSAWSIPKIEEERTRLAHITRALSRFIGRVEQAADALDAIRVEREYVKSAMEVDRLATLQREEDLRQQQMQRDEQMKLFIQSTHSQGHVQYYDTQWAHWEDVLLLNAIRKRPVPSCIMLAGLVEKGRTAREVKTRIEFLKDFVRTKYARVGTRPPKWCVR